MELRDLRYFVQVADDRRYTKAAAHLFVSQPAISKAIRKMEDELGAQLFDTQPDGVYLTDCGEVLYARATTILQQFDAIPDAIDAVKMAVKGRLAIGMGPMVNELYGREIINQFCQRYPDIEIRVEEMGSLALQKMLENHETDINIYISLEKSDVVETIPLLEDTIVVCVSDKNSLAEREKLSFKDLQEVSYNLYTSASLMYQQIMDKCKQAGYVPKVGFSSTNISSLVKSTLNGTGVYIMPRPYAEHILCPGLKIIPLEDAFPWRVLLGWVKNNYQSHAAQLFAKHVKHYFALKTGFSNE